MATSDTISDLATNPPVQHDMVWYVLATLTHVISMGAIVGALTGMLPVLSAVGALVWYILQIWETKTVQSLWTKHKARKTRSRRRTTRGRSKATTRRRRAR